MKSFLFAFLVLLPFVAYGMEVKCFKAHVPIDCSQLILKEGQVVNFKVNAVNHQGKPAHVQLDVTGDPQVSVGQFSLTISHFDALQGARPVEFYAFDDDGVGTGVQPDSKYDARKNIELKVQKKVDPLDKTPAKIKHVKVFFKGQEYTDTSKLLLSEGDTVRYEVAAVTADGKPAHVKLSIVGDPRMSPTTYSQTVSHFDALNEALIGEFYALDDDNIGSGVQPQSSVDDLFTSFINVKKKTDKADKDPAKIVSIEINATKKFHLSGEAKTTKKAISGSTHKELKSGSGSTPLQQSTTKQ